jgi:hypothetical protein
VTCPVTSIGSSLLSFVSMTSCPFTLIDSLPHAFPCSPP